MFWVELVTNLADCVKVEEVHRSIVYIVVTREQVGVFSDIGGVVRYCHCHCLHTCQL